MLKGTQAFIEADGTDLSVSRKVKVSNGSGGYTTGPETVHGPFRVRLIPQSDRVPEVVMSDGRLMRPKFVILGMPGTDIRRDDVLVWKLKQFVVAAVHDGPEYEFKANVVQNGG